MKSIVKILLLMALLVPTPVLSSAKAAYTWNLMHDGIVYTKYSFVPAEGEKTTIHAFQVDPSKVRLDVVSADSKTGGGISVADLAKKKRAVIVINGGFYNELHKSIGLLISGGRRINPIHKTSWWSIFGLKDLVPFIIVPKEYRPDASISMALQAGPRLVVDGRIPKLKDGVASRSVVGITRDNKVVLAVTEGSPISMKEIARRMGLSRFEGGLECVNAMALDGGSSTQIYAKIGKFELTIPGLSYITNGIAVYLK